MNFRRRMRIQNIREEMQIDSLDQETRNLLYNIIMQFLPTEEIDLLLKFNSKIYPDKIGSYITKPLSFDISYMLSEKINNLIHRYPTTQIQEIIDKYDFSFTYDLIEIIYKYIELSRVNQFRDRINNALEIEKCNYRMGSDGKFIKCCCDEEFDNINEALNTDINPVKFHREKAVKAYSARGEEINGTKVCNEAIKAVEALVRKKSGDKYEKSTLGQCIDPLRQKLNIPSFVINPIEKIWVALNSPETGVRHAGGEDGSIIGEPEAYFILITCCSFINYVNKKVS